MEVIDQDPSDIRSSGPSRENLTSLWKILSIIFAFGFVISLLLLIFARPDGGSQPSSNSGSNNGSSSSSPDSGKSDSKSGTTTDLSLKDFDVNIPKLVGSVGFSNGSIMTLKTNSAGTYIIGEVKSGSTMGYAYRKLPDGEWKASYLSVTAENECKNIVKDEFDAFANVKVSSGEEVKCKDTRSSDGTTNVVEYSAADALKSELYKR